MAFPACFPFPFARSRPSCSFWGLRLRSGFSRRFRRGRWLYHKAIETTQSLILLFEKFAVCNRLCNGRFWPWSWRYDAIIAIEPLLGSVFYRKATSQFIRLCLCARTACANSGENYEPQPCPATVHGSPRFALSSMLTGRTVFLGARIRVHKFALAASYFSLASYREIGATFCFSLVQIYLQVHNDGFCNLKSSPVRYRLTDACERHDCYLGNSCCDCPENPLPPRSWIRPSCRFVRHGSLLGLPSEVALVGLRQGGTFRNLRARASRFSQNLRSSGRSMNSAQVHIKLS